MIGKARPGVKVGVLGECVSSCPFNLCNRHWSCQQHVQQHLTDCQRINAFGLFKVGKTCLNSTEYLPHVLCDMCQTRQTHRRCPLTLCLNVCAVSAKHTHLVEQHWVYLARQGVTQWHLALGPVETQTRICSDWWSSLFAFSRKGNGYNGPPWARYMFCGTLVIWNTSHHVTPVKTIRLFSFNCCIQYVISCPNMIAAIRLLPCCRLVLTALIEPFQGSLFQKSTKSRQCKITLPACCNFPWSGICDIFLQYAWSLNDKLVSSSAQFDNFRDKKSRRNRKPARSTRLKQHLHQRQLQACLPRE